jgi:hypothetical protein
VPNSKRPDGDDREAASSEGGESACWANLVCSVCGGVLDGEPHVHDADIDLDQ